MSAKTVPAYLMNPAEDDILFGGEIAEGMWVLPESRAIRCGAASAGEEEQIRAQCFRRVIRLRREPDTFYSGGVQTVFIGEWVDGYREVHNFGAATAWLVKKTDLAAGLTAEPAPGEDGAP